MVMSFVLSLFFIVVICIVRTVMIRKDEKQKRLIAQFEMTMQEQCDCLLDWAPWSIFQKIDGLRYVHFEQIASKFTVTPEDLVERLYEIGIDNYSRKLDTKDGLKLLKNDERWTGIAFQERGVLNVPRWYASEAETLLEYAKALMRDFTLLPRLYDT